MITKILIKYLQYIGQKAAQKRNEIVMNFLPQRGGKYLDVGCGNGFLTLQRADVMDTKNIYGIEALSSEVKKARENGIICEKVDLNKRLPYKDNMFDVVTATEVIEHLYDVDIFLSEIYRVMKKNGIFILTTENLAAWHNIFALVIGLQPSAGPFISKKFSLGFHPLYKEHIKDYKQNPHLEIMAGHTRIMTFKSCKKLMKMYKFSVLKEEGVGYYPFPPAIANVLASWDKPHALDMIFKLKKK